MTEYKKEMGQSILTAQADKIDKLSNHLKAAKKLIQVYRDTYRFLRHYKIETAEVEYEKATRERQDSTTVPPTNTGTKI